MQTLADDEWEARSVMNVCLIVLVEKQKFNYSVSCSILDVKDGFRRVPLTLDLTQIKVGAALAATV